jgi:hypothetical protein
VRAHVEEGAHDAVAPAHDDDRHARVVEYAEAAGLRQVRRKAHHLRQVAKQPCHFPLVPLRIGVGRDLVQHRACGKVRGAVARVLDHAPAEFQPDCVHALPGRPHRVVHRESLRSTCFRRC